MKYLEIIPDNPLSRFINKAWFLSYSSEHKQEKILPLPVHHFIVNLSDEPYRVVQQGDETRSLTFANGFISGIQSRYLVIENPKNILHVGVELTPYGLSAFTSLSPNNYINTVQQSEQVLAGSTALANKLRQINNRQIQMQQLLDFMSSNLRADYTLPVYLESSRPLLETIPSVAMVAQKVGVSHKQLSQQWKLYTGITPKQYQNVVRLQQVITWFEQADKPIRWSGLISDLPYSDQPYFIRTFRQLTGFSPRKYAAILERYPSGDQSFIALDDAYARLN